jgi:DNA-binding MarR family transcriptional regulator
MVERAVAATHPDVEVGVPWLDAEEMQAWVGLIKLSARLVALGDGELRHLYGITGRDYELLHHLSERDNGRRISELAQVIDDSSSCITHRVNRLHQAGLVDKRHDPDDRRARCVVLTREGQSLLERVAPDHVRRVRRWIIDPLDRRQLTQLARITATLNVHLHASEPVTD